MDCQYLGMPGRGATVILLLLFCGLLVSGCVSDTAGPVGNAPPEMKTHTPTTVSSGENQTYARARGLVPKEIPGFVLQSRAKEPLTIWEDPYHFHGYWTPAGNSTFNGSVMALSVDIFVYNNGRTPVHGSALSRPIPTAPVAIQGINTTYRFRGGVAEIAFMTDDILVHSSAIAARSPAGSASGEEAARKAAVTGAEMLIRNLA